eukprot:1182904-Prorocentrum_minimum.AAC.1
MHARRRPELLLNRHPHVKQRDATGRASRSSLSAPQTSHRDHLGNMKDHREHLGNIWGTFGEHLGNIWGSHVHKQENRALDRKLVGAIFP